MTAMVVRIQWTKQRSWARTALRALEAILLVAGAVGLGVYGWLWFERDHFEREYLRQFDQMTQVAVPDPGEPAHLTPSPTPAPAPAPLAKDDVTPVLARLRIDRLGIEAPVLDDTDDRSLRRGAGWIHGTARPGQPGNVGIAAHRDTFFRPLREIRPGDQIQLDTPAESRQYVVQTVYVVEPDNTAALRPTAAPTLTLVTCFPFDYIGSAPRRYIVQAIMSGS